MVSKLLKRVTSSWIITILTLFICAIIFGIIMRLNQGNDIELSHVGFYSLMTTHGLTMISIWAIAGMVSINYLLTRYVEVKVSVKANVLALVLTVIGVLMLWATTFIGKFHAGWTFLYPLPLFEAWAAWATPIFYLSLTILNVGWLIWTCAMMLEILKKYSLSQVFALQHLFKKNPEVETPPFIVIAGVSLLGVIICLFAALIVIGMTVADPNFFSTGKFINDPILMKNLTYFYGHTIANEALYLGLAGLYELMPEVSGRPKFHTTWYIALGWNLTFVFVLTAYFHHMYMDFAQPLWLQMFGQFSSYFASLPAAAVSMISVIVLIYGNKIKWNIVNIIFFIGVVGWAIGGIGAVIDSTISNNIFLHNTLWVPAHFHTYNAMGNVLFSLAFFYWVANEFSNNLIPTKLERLKVSLLTIGGFGFVLMFYIAGADSIPRRYAKYPLDLTDGPIYATIAAIFATIYLIAMLLILGEILKKCTKVFSKSAVA